MMEDIHGIENRKPVNYKIGFADSEIISYTSDKNCVVVYLLTWNETVLKMEFVDYICFFTYGAADISDVCENPSSELLKIALENMYEKIPDNHGYKLYEFVNLQDEAAMEIVCKDLLITEAQDHPLNIK